MAKPTSNTSSPSLSVRARLNTWFVAQYAAGVRDGVLGAWIAARAKALLDTDAELAAHYAALRQLEREAAGSAVSGLSPMQREQLLSAVLAAPAPVAAPARVRFVGVGAALSACAAVTVLVVAPREADAPAPRVEAAAPLDSLALGTLTARGDATTAPFGLRLRCVVADSVVAETAIGARQTDAELACQQAGTLALSTTNLSSEARYVFAVAVDPTHNPVFLGPFQRDAAATRVEPNTADTILPQGAPMASLSASQSLFLLWSDAPFQGADVAAHLEQAKRAGIPLHSLATLPFSGAGQARLTLKQVK